MKSLPTLLTTALRAIVSVDGIQGGENGHQKPRSVFQDFKDIVFLEMILGIGVDDDLLADGLFEG